MSHHKQCPDSLPPLARRETHIEKLYRHRHHAIENRWIREQLVPHKGKPVVFTHITNQPRKG